jgi:hypothetical protein
MSDDPWTTVLLSTYSKMAKGSLITLRMHCVTRCLENAWTDAGWRGSMRELLDIYHEMTEKSIRNFQAKDALNELTSHGAVEWESSKNGIRIKIFEASRTRRTSAVSAQNERYARSHYEITPQTSAVSAQVSAVSAHPEGSERCERAPVSAVSAQPLINHDRTTEVKTPDPLPDLQERLWPNGPFKYTPIDPDSDVDLTGKPLDYRLRCPVTRKSEYEVALELERTRRRPPLPAFKGPIGYSPAQVAKIQRERKLSHEDALAAWREENPDESARLLNLRREWQN